MKKDFLKMRLDNKAKTALVRTASRFIPHLIGYFRTSPAGLARGLPCLVLPNSVSIYLGIAPYRLKNPSLASSSAGIKSIYENIT